MSPSSRATAHRRTTDKKPIEPQLVAQANKNQAAPRKAKPTANGASSVDQTAPKLSEADREKQEPNPCTSPNAPGYCLDPQSRVAPPQQQSAAPAETVKQPDESLDSLDQSGLGSREALFGTPEEGTPAAASVKWSGFVLNTTAYTYAEPVHWSRGVVRLQVGAQGGNEQFTWKATVRGDVDPIVGESNFYPEEVRQDQRSDFFVRETYVDTSVGPFDLRLGKQNIVWGEMVGLFFADVVSAKDLRDFILPEFEIIRIPQWAARVEHFGENWHAEVVWLPLPEVDLIGKPGAEFYPFQFPAPPGFNQQIANEEKPDHSLSNSNGGVRLSTLQAGWDVSAFYYRSYDAAPTFYREIRSTPTPTLVYTPRHDRIWQAGATLGKALGSTVLKAEAVYTNGRKYNVTNLTQPDGLVVQNTVVYVVGLDYTFTNETRLNVQYFESVFLEHDPDILPDARESGVSMLVSGRLGSKLKPELFIIQNLNRNESLVRPKLVWEASQNVQVATGVDIFTGPVTGVLGRFNDRDRVYVNIRYDF